MSACPWDGLEPASVAFCEARLCAHVVEPSNAWSSWGYVVLGLWLLSRPEARQRALLAGVALANVAIGLGSFAFHATGTFVGELIDLFGMFLLSGLMLAHALGRARTWSPGRVGLAWSGFVAAPMLGVLLVKPAGIPLFAAQLLAAIGLEVRAWRRAQSPHFGVFAQALGLVSLAFVVWLGDTTKLVCDPDNHLVTGHAVWHALNAVAIARLFFFYARAR